MGIRFRIIKAKGKRYAAIVENFRDPATGKSRTTCIKSYGNLDVLKAANPNIEEELKEEAARLEKSMSAREEVEADQSNYFRYRSSEKVTAEASRCFPLGEAILRRTWEDLKLHELLSRITTEKKLGYNFDHAVYAMSAGRLTDYKQSKLKCKRMMDESSLFDYSDVSPDNIYDSLELLADKKRRIIKFLNRRIDELCERKVRIALYDVTTCYFESFDRDELRVQGLSKEHRTAETRVVTGLLIDEDGIPLDYELFPGNTHEIRTILKVVNDFLASYGIEKVTIVADCGLNSAANVMALHEQGSNFIVTQSLKKLKESKLNEVLNTPLDQWYFPDRDSGEDPAAQRRFLETDLIIEADATDDAGNHLIGEDGKKIRKKLRVRMVVNFSHKRFLKDRKDIDERENKANSLLKQGPAAIEKIKGSKVEYLKKCGLDANGKSTGKAPSKKDRNYTYELNTQAIEKQRKTAGCYAFITDISKEETDGPTLYGQLRSLWKIENCFRIMKTTLNARPVCVYKPSHIRGHFMMCYLALVLEQLCLKKIKANVDSSFSTAKLKEFLLQISYTRIFGVKRSTSVYQKVTVTSDENVALYDKIYQCFGIEELKSLESAQNLSRKLGLTMRFAPRLVPQANPKDIDEHPSGL